MKIPFLDLGGLHASIREELDAAYASVLADGGFVNGAPVRVFEEDFAAAHRVANAASCGSGTDALMLALAALGVGPGDEVVVPAMTFVATAEAVVHVGARPVVADTDPRTLLLTAATVAPVLTPRTKAVMPVHLYGHVVPFDEMQAWRDAGLLVIEDAAQAHLATWNEQVVGSASDAACFSFYPGKNLGALGDGGMVIARDASVTSRVCHLRDHGRSDKYLHHDIGWCSRLDAMQAAFLSVKLRHLAEWTNRRRAVADVYRNELPDLLVPWEHGAVHHLIVVRVPGEQREAIRSALREDGIGSGLHYPYALSQQPALGSGWSCPNAERAAAEVLSLPLDPYLEHDDVRRVCAVVRKAIA